MAERNFSSCRYAAVRVGNLLMQRGIIEHLSNDLPFLDKFVCYKFVEDS